MILLLNFGYFDIRISLTNLAAQQRNKQLWINYLSMKGLSDDGWHLSDTIEKIPVLNGRADKIISKVASKYA